MFDDEDNMVRIDMSEYGERHTVSRLIGAPPGYVGYDEAGGLTEQVRRRPYSIILFDEIEKAHPEVLNVLLQVMEDGRLTDGHGRTVDFRNTVVIMTSNLGSAQDTRTPFGFSATERSKTDAERQQLVKNVERALQSFFRPEFLNRIDEVIIFEPLTPTELRPIVDIMLREVSERLEERQVTLTLTEAAKVALVEEGYDRVYGARPLRRTVERRIENPLSRASSAASSPRATASRSTTPAVNTASSARASLSRSQQALRPKQATSTTKEGLPKSPLFSFPARSTLARRPSGTQPEAPSFPLRRARCCRHQSHPRRC
jgi:ATP-dependent Clp protease ATP-binding subunit ClpC